MITKLILHFLMKQKQSVPLNLKYFQVRFKKNFRKIELYDWKSDFSSWGPW